MQWPWLLQSSPVLYLACIACWRWASADWTRALSLGTLHTRKTRQSTRLKEQLGNNNCKVVITPFLMDSVGTYIYHLAGMTTLATFVMHVNVATRFLSSCPPLYWYAAVCINKGIAYNTTHRNESQEHIEEVDKKQKKRRVIWSSDWIWLWTLISAILGCILFPNFFPWT